jgi:isoquinoline 1-oxidoreductase beta subunit
VLAPLANAPRTIEAEFVFPCLAHAPMEPLNCTVQLSEGRAELWVGTQFPGVDSAAAARVLGHKPEQVKMNVQMAGGGFGRRGLPSSDYVVEACEIANAARAAGINAPVRIVKNGIDATATEGMREPYGLPMRLTVHHPKVNVPVLWWRSVGSTHTAFVMETLLDDIARATKQDPVAYRMRLFGDKHPRHRAALQLAVDKSGYGKKQLPAGRAWGVAVHESFSSVVAYVVEASVKNGSPVLHRVHCNLAIKPKSVETQVQGAAVMGLSMCLPGSAITLKDGVVEQSNFGDFTMARITDMPEINVHVVPSADPPTGIGEPGLPPLAPAFANAIAQLTGKPLRELPFKLA